MHRGHARTFLIAQERALHRDGQLILRIEDLDRDRCKPEFESALLEDLKWAGLRWDEGPDIDGTFGSYRQSERMEIYRSALHALHEQSCAFPCHCSRKDVLSAVQAPHEQGGELIYPGHCRDRPFSFDTKTDALGVNWRMRVPVGETIAFQDGACGEQRFVAGRDFGDFLIWRKDGVPAYELAVVLDDIAMKVTEVVRGEDLLLSTARQLLIYRALGATPPSFYHCPLVVDETGKRLAKRDKAMSLRELRREGFDPKDLRR